MGWERRWDDDEEDEPAFAPFVDLRGARVRGVVKDFHAFTDFLGRRVRSVVAFEGVGLPVDLKFDNGRVHTAPAFARVALFEPHHFPGCDAEGFPCRR
ncbi:MAG: hypothetical protein DPW18_01180 [Chloroflexi bacterium]|nr:hypothetical protein [Chloroflexota bacterium]